MCQEVNDFFVCGYGISRVGLTVSVGIVVQISLCIK